MNNEASEHQVEETALMVQPTEVKEEGAREESEGGFEKHDRDNRGSDDNELVG